MPTGVYKRTKDVWNKGKTYEELYGTEKANRMKADCAERTHTVIALEKQAKTKRGKSLLEMGHSLDCHCFACRARRKECRGAANSFYGKKQSKESIQKMLSSERWKNRDIKVPLDAMRVAIQKLKRTDKEWYARWRKNIEEGGAGRGKKGYYFSRKNNCKIFYASEVGELYAYLRLEADPSVVKYGRCAFSLHYILDGIAHRYRPDIMVEYADGGKEIIEVKAGWELEYPKTSRVLVAKLLVLREYCEENGLKYSLWTEKDYCINNNKGG